MARPGILLVLTMTATFLCLTACMKPTTPVPHESDEGGKTFYFDASLGFTVEYPEGWEKQATHIRHATRGVRWTAPVTPLHREGEAVIASIPKAEGETTHEILLENFLKDHRTFTVSSREFLSGRPDKPTILEVVGHTPERVYLLRFIITEVRAFTLEFSSPPEYFDLYRHLFEEMAESFSSLY